MSVDPIPAPPQEPAAPTPDDAAPPAPAPERLLPASPLGPEFAARKAAAFAAVEAEAAGGAVPDADEAGDAGAAGGAPAAPAAEPAPDAGDERPLSRSERYEYKQLQAEVERLKSAGTQSPPGQQPGQQQQAPSPAPTEDAQLAEVRRDAGLDAPPGGADYQTLSRLTQSRDYDALARLVRTDGQAGGYTLEEALVELQQMGRVQKALAGTAGYFERRAIAMVGSDLDAAAVSLGLDPAEAVRAAQQAQGSPVAAYLKRLIDAAERRGAAEWQGRYEAEAAAHRGTRAGRLGARATVETGGGSAASGPGLLERALSGASDRNDFIERAKRGEYVGLDLSER